MGFVFSIKDSYRHAVESASGGRQTVLYDDLGNPSVMTIIPAFNIKDVLTGYGSGLHPAFLVSGVAKPEIFIGSHLGYVADGRAYSLPGVLPRNYVTWDQAEGYCAAKGAGWHLMTNWEWAALALWCEKNGYQPRGNTYYGRHHDQKHETGVRTDGGLPGDGAGSASTLTGSGPASWRHDGTLAGVADMVGNVWEWQAGLKFVDGRVYMPEDNQYDLSDAGYPATDVYIDKNGSAPMLSDQVTDSTTDETSISVAPWSAVARSSGYDALPAASRERMVQALVQPVDGCGLVGTFYARNNGERLPARGGRWSSTANAGVGALGADCVRSASHYSIGFRPAFLKP